MSDDKYGTDQAPDCYPGTDVLINLLDLRNAEDLDEAERYINEMAAAQLEFVLPPYSLATLKQVHRTLFEKVYAWAGEIRTLAISKGSTRFCSPEFIESQIAKEFSKMAAAGWFESYSRDQLVSTVAESYGTLNVAHPFREGNGRTQRILFEFIIFNAGYLIDWGSVEREEWIDACIHSFHCDDSLLEKIFDRCIGASIL
ncbi:Fic/DOC family protein [Pseudomonas sp. P2757]|uniref:Fic/DOC family protein n=1 Tax=unclassified Pseudomonas TaxID=196821 RepID=UPI003B594166